MDVSKNKGTQKWMAYFMENPMKIDDLGVPLFLETPIYCIYFDMSRYGASENLNKSRGQRGWKMC